MLEKLRKMLEAAIQRMKALSDSTLNDKGEVRSFSDAEKTEYTELEKKVSELRESIKREETRAEAERELEKLNKVERKAPAVAVVREDKCNEKGEYRGFKVLGEQMQAVARAERGDVDPRLVELDKHERAAAGMNEAVAAEGGFFVQTDFMGAMLDKTFKNSQIADLCNRKPISNNSNAIEFPTIKETSRADGSRNGGVQSYWTSEAGTISATKPELEYNKITLEKLTGLCYASEEMLADAAFLSSWIADLFADEFSFKLDAAIIEGDGAGKPLGIKKSAALVSVAKKANQTADTIVVENIVKMFAAMLPRGQREAVWLINPFAIEQLPLMTIGQQPVYLPPGGVSGNQYGLLLGRPVIPFEACEKLGDAGDIYFSWMKKYMLAEKGGLQGATSAHVKFLTAEQAFRFILRINGQPLLRSAITPYKGNTGDKFSAYVTLEARA